MKHGFLFCIIYLFVVPLRAQTPAYLHYAVSDGLPSNLVYCGTQDKKGMLWFGTDKGLASFDGTRFRTFGIRDGLTDPEVLNVWEDSRERLWICCFQKKLCYRQNARIRVVEDSTFEDKSGLTPLYTFFEDTDSSIWIATTVMRNYLLSGQRATLLPFTNSIRSFARLSGMLVALGQTEIIHVTGGGTFEKLPTTLTRDFSINKNNIDGVAVSGNRVLYAHSDILYLYEWDGNRFNLIERKVAPTGRLFTDQQGRFWICSSSAGVICFDNTDRNLAHPVYYLQGKKVTSMFEDNQGTKWFCTLDDGIYGLPKASAVTFTTSDGLISNNITTLAAGRDGSLMAGDDNANLYRIKGTVITGTKLDSIDSYNRCRQIVVRNDGSPIIVTDKMIYVNAGNKMQRLGKTLGRFLGAPKSILIKNDTIWIGTHAYFGYTVNGSDEYRRVVEKRRVTRIVEDHDGFIWFGSVDGLYSQKDNFVFNWSKQFPVLNGRIVDIQRGEKNGLWIVTPENGLLFAQTRMGEITDVKVMNNNLQTPIENIQCVFAAPGGLLWLGTNHGVFGLYPDGTVVHFDRHDGLANDDVNALLVCGDTLWVASVSGLSRLLFGESDLTGKFPTYITRLNYRYKDVVRMYNLSDSLSDHRHIILPPDASVIEISMSGIDYRSRGNLRYICVITKNLLPWYYWSTDNLFSWIGNGFRGKSDTSRITGGEINFGVYLPPATYTIQATAVTTGNVVSRLPDCWTMVMLPHWYATIWVTIFIWGMAVSALWWLFRTNLINRHLHTQVSELQLQALQAQMNPHFIGNSINTIQQFFYSPDPVKASEYTSVFIRLLRSTM
ncbi:MAG: histidine kinase, partial [Saprospiraceae bacterium]|nr:histidine kinase [Saprospiraceae bacterium]